MQPRSRTLKGVVLLLMLMAPALIGCGANRTPGGPPSPSSTATPAPTPSPSPTLPPTPTPTVPTPAPTQTTPGPGWTVVSSRVAYAWRWPGGDGGATVSHPRVTPVLLTTIGVGDHPSDPGDRPYNRMSFSFTDGYPSYHFGYVAELVADGSGQTIPLEGYGALRIVFTPAQAHTMDGTASTIVSQPPAHLGLARMVSYARAGDFEGYLTYGIGITYPIRESNPQIQVRVYEVTYVNAQQAYRYVVAFDVDAR